MANSHVPTNENAGKYGRMIREGSSKKENSLDLDLIDMHHFKDAENTSESVEN